MQMERVFLETILAFCSEKLTINNYYFETLLQLENGQKKMPIIK